jgi:hypothetical protein
MLVCQNVLDFIEGSVANNLPEKLVMISYTHKQRMWYLTIEPGCYHSTKMTKISWMQLMHGVWKTIAKPA